jgi:hypothetical protein
VDPLLTAKIGFGPLHRLGERGGIDRERGLAGAMLVSGLKVEGLRSAGLRAASKSTGLASRVVD